jgi:methylthioribose-1-phosphate isomerase
VEYLAEGKTKLQSVGVARDVVKLIDQRKLPKELVTLACTDYHQVGEAIKTLAVRGAPAIGVAAAGGLSLAAQALKGESPEAFWAGLEAAAKELAATRPTAVNLFWAIEKVMQFAKTQKEKSPAEVAEAIYRYAVQLAESDVETNKRMAEIGEALVPQGAGILTHCNTGALATVD